MSEVFLYYAGTRLAPVPASSGGTASKRRVNKLKRFQDFYLKTRPVLSHVCHIHSTAVGVSHYISCRNANRTGAPSTPAFESRIPNFKTRFPENNPGFPKNQELFQGFEFRKSGLSRHGPPHIGSPKPETLMMASRFRVERSNRP